MAKGALVLVGEGFSPWTEKARWALDHRHVAHRYEEFTPILSEPWLRLRARRFSGIVSVPFLLGEGLAVGDSFAIARASDAMGEGPALVPPDLDAAITEWNARSDRLMRAGRAQILVRTEESTDVRVESLPPSLPLGVRRVLAPSARLGTTWLRRKYEVRDVSDDALDADLAAIREATRGEAGRPLLGHFTYADIAIAAALQAVRPHAVHPLGLQPAQRAAWERPALASRWEDVLAWRDAIYRCR